MTFHPERMIFARKRRQMTQTDLARATGLAARSLRRIEHGEDEPRADNVERISKALDFPVEFFLDARPLPELAERSLSFRAYSTLRARERDGAVTVAQLAVEIESALAEHFDLPAPQIPDLREDAPEPVTAAKLLRSMWKLGSGPIGSVVDVLESRGVRVFSLALDTARVDAFCFWHEGTPFVVLNRTKTAERGRFDGTHELGHLVLHRTIDFSSRDVEREADAFAAEFLVPRDALEKQVPAFITIDTVLKLKRYWRVSAMAMARRLRDIGRLSEWSYRGMIIELSERGYRTGEPDGIEQETSSLLAEMLSGEDGVAVSEIARSLGVPVTEVTPLVFRGTMKRVQPNRRASDRGR